MARLGEEVIVEWLNRAGYFTIRGIRKGNTEINILAIKPLSDGTHHCRHIEVQLSHDPISYAVAFSDAKKRNEVELRGGVQKWIEKKYRRPVVVELKEQLCAETWTEELVLWIVKHEEEAVELDQAGIKVWWLKDVLLEMQQDSLIPSAAGGELVRLISALAEDESDSQ